MKFPEGFLWGAASAAAQIEGAADTDGKALSVWDALTDGKIRHGDTTATACDFYHRYGQDIALMKQIGLRSFRFSVSWPRVMSAPDTVNEKGLAFYVRLADALKAAGIEPICTLYHWDLPMWAYERGGWENEEICDWFARYARVVTEALSDRVRWWMTFNEPQCFIGAGYKNAAHPPYLREISRLPQITRSVMLAHGKAVLAIRAYAKQPPLVGFAPTGSVFTPLEETPEAIERARAASYQDGSPFGNSWWSDPIVLGAVPESLRKAIRREDLRIIHQPLDYYAFNVYNSENYKEEYTDTHPLLGPIEMPKGRKNPLLSSGQPRTAMGWPITPEVMYWSIRFHHERYRLPVLISENGMANIDFVMEDGQVHDPQRIDYIHRHLRQVGRAVSEGIPVLGYQYWSLTDNFEWAEGYDRRFGLIYVDYATQKRVLKDSAYDYAEIIRTGGECL